MTGLETPARAASSSIEAAAKPRSEKSVVASSRSWRRRSSRGTRPWAWRASSASTVGACVRGVTEWVTESRLLLVGHSKRVGETRRHAGARRGRAQHRIVDRRRRLRRPRHGDQPAPPRASTTSSSSSAADASAAPGATTPIPAAPATCPRTSTRSPSRRTRTGAAPSPPQPEIHDYLKRTAARERGRGRASASTPSSTDARWDEDGAAPGGSRPPPGALRAQFLLDRDRRPGRAAASRHPGPRRLRGRGLPLGPLEPRLRPARQARRRDRHRRLGDPVRPADPARGRASSTSSSAPRPGSRRAATGRSRRSSARLFRRFPKLQRLSRGAIFWSREALVLGFVKRPRLMKLIQRVAEAPPAPPGQGPRAAPQADAGLHDRLQADPDLQRLLPGARRRTTSSCSTEGLAEVRGNGVVGSDGSEREVDAIILGTGFQVTDFPGMKVIHGRDGASLAEHWDGSPQRPPLARRSPASPTCS